MGEEIVSRVIELEKWRSAVEVKLDNAVAKQDVTAAEIKALATETRKTLEDLRVESTRRSIADASLVENVRWMKRLGWWVAGVVGAVAAAHAAYLLSR